MRAKSSAGYAGHQTEQRATERIIFRVALNGSRELLRYVLTWQFPMTPELEKELETFKKNPSFRAWLLDERKKRG